jgi:hypothetical protein
VIGPNVTQAIIDRTGDNWKGFPFLFALCTAATIVIWFGVDVGKGRRDALRWAEQTRMSRVDEARAVDPGHRVLAKRE